MTKFCITCKAEGHTYLECERVPFFNLFSAAIGVPVLCGKQPDELAEELRAIEREQSTDHDELDAQ